MLGDADIPGRSGYHRECGTRLEFQQPASSSSGMLAAQCHIGAGEDVCGVFGGRDGGQVAPNGPDRFIDEARQSAAIDQALYGADYGVISQFVSPTCLVGARCT